MDYMYMFQVLPNPSPKTKAGHAATAHVYGRTPTNHHATIRRHIVGSIVFLDPAGSQTLTLQTMVSDTFHFLLGIFFETLLRGTPIQMKKITSSVGLLHEDRNQSSPQITTK